MEEDLRIRVERKRKKVVKDFEQGLIELEIILKGAS